MADITPKLALPFIIAAQAQKEVTHNEALIALDALVQLIIEDRDLNGPPTTPNNGQIWLIKGPAAGAWAGREDMLAQFHDGSWRFYAPFSGMGAWLKDEQTPLRHDGAQWQTGAIAAVGPAGPAIADPSGGVTVDSEARATISSLLQLLRGHGLIANA